MPKGGISEADKRIGQNIRRYRMERRLSQEKLGDALQLTFQQVQKYEKGTNRVSGGRLQVIAAFLGCSVLDLLGEERPGHVTPDVLRDLGQTRAGLELARAFTCIESAALRQTLVDIARALAGEKLRRPPLTLRHRIRQDRAPMSAGGSVAHPQAQARAPIAAPPSLRGANRATPGS